MAKKSNKSTLFHTETPDEKKKRMRAILKALRKDIPRAACALHFRNPFQLLVSTILSAQCTDERVNKVTPELFRAFPTPKNMAEASTEELIEYIRSTGFFNHKAKNLKACCMAIVEKHGGQVPSTMEELTALPGVGRKTANVILGNAFGVPGLAVDTHVTRISNLLQFTDTRDAVKIEQHLTAIIPKQSWTEASHLFILHGRKTCVARRPKCSECVIARYCPSAQSR